MVLVLDAPELVEAALALRASAQRQGLSIQQHAEGFMPHVTLAVCAHTPVFELIKQPSLLLTTARLIELHSRYDALALRESEISEKALDVGDAVADITL
jgi:2'-5' RNA ligase